MGVKYKHMTNCLDVIYVQPLMCELLKVFVLLLPVKRTKQKKKRKQRSYKISPILCGAGKTGH